MTSSHRGSRRDEDRLSPESYQAMLAALTLIKAQAQMVERWARRGSAPDTDVVVRRLRSIDQMVGRMVEALDAMPASPGVEGDSHGAPNGSGPT
jgi:hypothetical protein